MTMTLNPTSVNAKLTALERQRNAMANDAVNIAADLALAQEQAAQFKAIADKAIARVAELEAKYEQKQEATDGN